METFEFESVQTVLMWFMIFLPTLFIFIKNYLLFSHLLKGTISDGESHKASLTMLTSP